MAEKETVCAGIDVGSRTVKVVLLRRSDGSEIGSSLAAQGVKQEELAGELLDQLLCQANLGRSEVAGIVATGYGRNVLSFADRTVTEITCHARGVLRLHPQARTIIEIGGQDSKLIRIDERGSVYDFAMNDRCAAGTGQFLELVARRLGVELDSLGRLARASTAPAPISSMCAVFAETEIIGLLASQTPPADIVAGVCRSVASRLTGLSCGKIVEPVYFTGGVALLTGMEEAIAASLGCPVQVAAKPQMTGAMGAAIIACEQSRSG